MKDKIPFKKIAPYIENFTPKSLYVIAVKQTIITILVAHWGGMSAFIHYS